MSCHIWIIYWNGMNPGPNCKMTRRTTWTPAFGRGHELCDPWDLGSHRITGKLVFSHGILWGETSQWLFKEDISTLTSCKSI